MYFGAYPFNNPGILRVNDAKVTAWPYEIVTPPAGIVMTLAALKEWLRISPSDTSQDNVLTSLIKTVTSAAERLTNRTMLESAIRTYRNVFGGSIQLRKFPVNSVTSIQYYKDGVLTTVDPSTYYLEVSTGAFPAIDLVYGQYWPTDGDIRRQAIQINFLAGYTAENIPEELLTAMKNHAAQLFESRGDSDITNKLPDASKEIYARYRISDLNVPSPH